MSNMSGVPGFATTDETWVLALRGQDRFFVSPGVFGDLLEAKKFTHEQKVVIEGNGLPYHFEFLETEETIALTKFLL